ncbi:hypothetical protein [Carnobacterium mobile]|uniref:hypothetical protein n=1 Tax=Carnobacterium mobile TaxID=2750 RepID=UPI0005511771|nr:hypothetical protein [Carnobacterium mobile]
MNIHEKVDMQYKFVEAFNSRNDENDGAIKDLETLVGYYKEGHEVLSSMDIVNEMFSVIQDMYSIEIEKDTLSKVIRIIGEEV